MDNNARRTRGDVTRNIIFLYSFLIILNIRDSGNRALHNVILRYRERFYFLHTSRVRFWESLRQYV